MKKTEQEKQQFMTDHFDESLLDFIFSEIKFALENDPQIDSYDMFLASMSELLERIKKSPWPEKASDFIEKFYLEYEDAHQMSNCSEFREPYEIYCRITRTYFVLTHWQGKKFFRMLLQKFPVKDEKNIISTWTNNFILSQFRSIRINDKLYFEDIRTQQKYLIENPPKILAINGKALPELFVALILPTEKAYTTEAVLNCEGFKLIHPSFIKNMSKRSWEEFLLQWYSKNLLEFVTDRYGRQETKLPVFYAANQLKGESNEEFANRLIEQDRFLSHFPKRQILVSFLIEVIQTFPKLFDAKVNAISLLQAIKLLFTDIDFENEIEFEKQPVDFWLYLILTTLPEQAAQLRKYRLQ
ncbi:MAG TPA: hypothetical protein VK118_00430 [Tetragenococcus sp.]|nr:hypothetical protein [Tetragenococcus sp.]